MKIVFYINILSHGGAERVISNVATMMSERGHDCTLLTSYPVEDDYKVGEKVKRNNLSPIRIDGFLKRNMILTYKLRKYIKKEKPDILVSFMAEPNYRSCLASMCLKVKTVLSVRNDPNHEYGGAFHSFLAKNLFKLADGTIFQTEDAKSWFPQKIQDKGAIIMNSVHENFFNINLPDQRSGIVATGRLCPQKNHKMLIKAYSLIASEIPDDLTIYGAGNSRSLIEYATELGVEKRVHLPGLATDVHNTIKNYRLYVMSSDYEGMPNALMEAMAVGLPCISTDCPCGGPRMIFNETLKECLVPVGESNLMAAKMLELLCDNNKLNSIGRLCKQQAEIFRPIIINNQWESYLTNI